MKPNVGSLDRIVRIIAGLAVVIAGLYYHSWLGALGLLPILTGLFRFCPGYLPFGINTCGKKPDAGTPPPA